MNISKLFYERTIMFYLDKILDIRYCIKMIKY